MKIIKTATIPMSLDILLKGQLKFLNQYYEVVGLSSSGNELEEVRNREGIRVISVDMERRISLIKDLKSLIKLYFVFKKEKPLIVHSITGKAGLLSAMAAKFAGVPLRLHTFTGLLFPYKTGLFRQILIAMDKLLCYCATNVYPEGQGVKYDLEKFKITSKPLKVLGNGNVNGIDINYFSRTNINNDVIKHIAATFNIDLSAFIFVFVGRLVKDKGINELVKAFSETKVKLFQTAQSAGTDKPSVKLLLVGPMEEKLDPLDYNTLNVIQNDPDIITVGFQKDVRPFLAMGRVFVFPSYREGFPNSVLQAGAMDLPSIVSDISGCNEIIIDKINGLIVPSKNSSALSSAMQQLFTDVMLYDKMVSNSRKLIQSRFEQSFVWNAYLEEYRKLIKERHV